MPACGRHEDGDRGGRSVGVGEVDPERLDIVIPTDFVIPPDGLNIRWPDTPLALEARLLDYKLYAALAYCRTNKLNHTVIDSPHADSASSPAAKPIWIRARRLRTSDLTSERARTSAFDCSSAA